MCFLYSGFRGIGERVDARSSSPSQWSPYILRSLLRYCTRCFYMPLFHSLSLSRSLTHPSLLKSHLDREFTQWLLSCRSRLVWRYQSPPFSYRSQCNSQPWMGKYPIITYILRINNSLSLSLFIGHHRQYSDMCEEEERGCRWGWLRRLLSSLDRWRVLAGQRADQPKRQLLSLLLLQQQRALTTSSIRRIPTTTTLTIWRRWWWWSCGVQPTSPSELQAASARRKLQRDQCARRRSCCAFGWGWGRSRKTPTRQTPC